MFLLYMCTVLVLPVLCHSSGYFELQINTVRNVNQELSNGSCCDGTRDGLGACTDGCDTYIHVCLKEYQARVVFDGLCTFGNVSSKVFGGSSFIYGGDTTETRLNLPFDFAWTVSESTLLF